MDADAIHIEAMKAAFADAEMPANISEEQYQYISIGDAPDVMLPQMTRPIWTE